MSLPGKTNFTGYLSENFKQGGIVINLSDVTFNIPVRFDSPERKENIELVIFYLFHHFKTNLYVCEEAEQKKFEYLKKYGCRYFYLRPSYPNLHRTRCLNFMATQSRTPIISHYDCDVLFKPGCYEEAVEKIRKNVYDLCFPFGGKFYDMPRRYYEKIKSSLSLDEIKEKDCLLLNSRSIGGAMFWNKKSFIAGGMENENFIGWGYDDNERVERFTKLGFKVGRVEGSLFHLAHPRKSISSFNSFKKIIGYIKNPHPRKNKKEFRKVKSMSKEDLREYVKSWPVARDQD
jgi:hypothetical protein